MKKADDTIRRICVYCGSRPGTDAAYMAAGTALGTAIAEAGYGLVYGGGTKGIMGAVARGVLDRGGNVLGIIPEFLVDMEATRDQLAALDELIITPDMHVRKHKMFERADAFVALPGGIGTLEEIVEIMTWAQLGQHQKPMIFANIEGFWNPMIELLDHMHGQGFLHSSHQVRPQLIDQIEDVLPAIEASWEETAAEDGQSGIISRL
ncbi:TIGR00730 family Rossman fold protein [Martelella endophytica]|uniref:Cytokinin riboside 5'-monophosphate phosphoribohydrolase n=1 Tax=Martelella endophytica TaxID=1486262 RepID=A0A0D5LW23_MAREN|nr:TIGR00730 family Rossman fold protein [Martelella endophytica]AJY48231.1 lysine decarboxylase [Martelella endophytica]